VSTTPQAPAYTPPSGYYKSFTFDKTGQVFADGKALNGLMLDIKSVAPPPEPKQQIGMGGLFNLSGMNQAPKENPYQMHGGRFSRLVTDAQGNVYAEIDSPKVKEPLGSGVIGMGGMQNPNGNSAIDMLYGTPAKQRIKLSGIALDPNTMSRNSSGDLGENQLYLRPDASNEGLYFAQVNKGSDIVAYAYSAFQQKQFAQGGPEQAENTAARRQGGNAGGGAGPTTPDEVTLLGS